MNQSRDHIAPLGAEKKRMGTRWMRGWEAASPWRHRLKRCAVLSPLHDEEVCGGDEMKVRRERRTLS